MGIRRWDRAAGDALESVLRLAKAVGVSLLCSNFFSNCFAARYAFRGTFLDPSASALAASALLLRQLLPLATCTTEPSELSPVPPARTHLYSLSLSTPTLSCSLNHAFACPQNQPISSPPSPPGKSAPCQYPSPSASPPLPTPCTPSYKALSGGALRPSPSRSARISRERSRGSDKCRSVGAGRGRCRGIGR